MTNAQHTLGPVVEAVVASRDPANAADFHHRAFGLDVLESNAGWARLGVRGTRSGFVRFVKADVDDAGPSPAPWDTGPRLLGIYSQDLDRTAAAVRAAKGRVGPLVRYEYGEFMRECVVTAPDHLYWTVPHVRPRRPSPALDADPGRLHGELHSAVVNVTDMEAALAFFAGAGGLRVLFDGVMTGPSIREMIGLPEGARLRLAFLGTEDQAPARLELMQFSGVPAGSGVQTRLGLRRLIFSVASPDALRTQLCAAGGMRLGDDIVLGPAGVEIELRGAR